MKLKTSGTSKSFGKVYTFYYHYVDYRVVDQTRRPVKDIFPKPNTTFRPL